MIKFYNYCKPITDPKLTSIQEFYLDRIEGEILPCPICGRIPIPTIRRENPIEEKPGRYLATVSCFGGAGIAHSSSSYRRIVSDYRKVLMIAIQEWNNGEIDYFENLEDSFRSCYTCKNYDREPGKKDGTCNIEIKKEEMEHKGYCIDYYRRMSSKEFASSLTRRKIV